MPLILPSNSISAGGYEVDNSLRFDSASSDYLSQTLPNNDASIDKWTYSGWIKKNSNGVETFLFHFWQDGSNRGGLRFNTDDTLFYYDRIGGTDIVRLKTNAVFRDPSAWYHILVKVDKSIATPNTQIYVNGIEQSLAEDSDYTQGEDGKINEAITLYINNYDGVNNIRTIMMSEVCWISGTSYEPTSFGEFDEDTGIWKPIDVSGLTFGTNGFYLPFENSGALGQDDSGNGNNFTVNNLTSIDQTTDTPTNNFATLNPLATNTSTSSSNFSEGNLELDRQGATSTWVGCVNTMGVTQGKWYAEYKVIDAGDPQNGVMIGVTNVDLSNFQNGGNDLQQSGEYGINYYAGGQILNDSSTVATYTAMSDGDIVMIALDIDNGKIYWGRNGTWENSGDPTSGATGTGAQNLSEISTGYTYCFNLACREDGNVQANYGNPPFTISSGNSDGNGYGNFEYAVPSGYYALNTKNLAEYG